MPQGMGSNPVAGTRKDQYIMPLTQKEFQQICAALDTMPAVSCQGSDYIPKGNTKIIIGVHMEGAEYTNGVLRFHNTDNNNEEDTAM